MAANSSANREPKGILCHTGVRMVQLNTLYSLENVKSQYWITEDLKILNRDTGKKLKVWTNARGYPMVTLQAEGRPRGINTPMHKLVALAFINNGPYELIEHLDDNKRDYRVKNLAFSDKTRNGKHAFVNGHGNRKERIFRLTLTDGSQAVGTMKELSQNTGISRMTMYDRFYKERIPSKRSVIRTIEQIQ